MDHRPGLVCVLSAGVQFNIRFERRHGVRHVARIEMCHGQPVVRFSVTRVEGNCLLELSLRLDDSLCIHVDDALVVDRYRVCCGTFPGSRQPCGFGASFGGFVKTALTIVDIREVDVGALLFVQFGSGLFELHPNEFEVALGVAHAGSGGLGTAGTWVVFAVLNLIPRGEVDEVEQQEIADDEQQCLIHKGGLVGLDARAGLGVHDELLAGAADVMDFDEGHAQDAKDVGGVGDGKADAELGREHFDGKGEGGAAYADVEAHVEEVIFVFEESQFEQGIAHALADFVHLGFAGEIHKELDRGKGDEEDGVEDNVAVGKHGDIVFRG